MDYLWGSLIGIACGICEFIILSKAVKVITDGGSSALAGLLMTAQLPLILAVLFLTVYFISIPALITAAVVTTVIITLLAAIRFIKNHK